MMKDVYDVMFGFLNGNLSLVYCENGILGICLERHMVVLYI